MKNKEVDNTSIFVDVVPREIIKKPEPLPVEKIEEKVEIKSEPEPVEIPVVVKGGKKSTVAPVAKKVDSAKKSVAKVSPDVPLMLPEISVPKSSLEDKSLPAPSIASDSRKDSVKEASTAKPTSVSGELSEVEDVLKDANIKGASPAARSSAKINAAGDSGIYNFDIAPDNRKLVYVPKEPSFALANDTKVTIKFSIDKFGNTSDIVFITRSSSEVERIAAAYVLGMRFDAALNDAKQSAQVTITFRVRR